jgi:imidazoleglycerol-phosphate dehydratase
MQAANRAALLALLHWMPFLGLSTQAIIFPALRAFPWTRGPVRRSLGEVGSVPTVCICHYSAKPNVCYPYNIAMTKRHASRQRTTTETSVSVDLSIDGTGAANVSTGIPFFDHMLTLLAKHSLFDLQIEARGDLAVDFHHTVEDTGILLGQCFNAALGNKERIRRYGSVLVPMDETLAQVAVDISGRPFLVFRATEMPSPIGDFDFSLIEEFIRGFTNNAAITLHVELRYGRNSHHMAEAIFKGLAKSLDLACQIDPRVHGVPSSKGTL